MGGALEVGTLSSPIQILDAGDATGVEFDRAFLTGLSEEHWPPVDQISPLIPLAVQRAHGVPGSSRQSAYERRARMTSALFSTAPSISVTFSGRLSPLAENFVSRELDNLTLWAGNLPIQSYEYVKLEEREDSEAPPFTAVEPKRGGTSVLKSQSLCPFRAFADHRLLSNAPEEACLGFDSRDRGSFLHTALQFVWQTLKTQECLRSTTREDLRRIVREAVLRSVKEDASSPFHQLTTSAEWDRLESLVLKWLDVERERAQPFTVETLEEKRSYEIPGLKLAMRIDRMDRLANGSVLLIDYKSGKQTASKLEGQRPAEPQLLVYAAATDDPVEGVFFGELTPRQPRAVGYGRSLQFEKRGIKKDWDTFISLAKENVAAIARGFVEGKAAVDPIKGACDYCSQKPFCRINERVTVHGAEDDDE
jgi:probable DNA repair protein